MVATCSGQWHHPAPLPNTSHVVVRLREANEFRLVIGMRPLLAQRGYNGFTKHEHVSIADRTSKSGTVSYGDLHIAFGRAIGPRIRLNLDT
jgi:hypothetical protein